jgi:hypothetical protein
MDHSFSRDQVDDEVHGDHDHQQDECRRIRLWGVPSPAGELL